MCLHDARSGSGLTIQHLKLRGRFLNLHVHSAYSLLDSISTPEQIAKKVKELGQPAIALTEHGNVFSSVKMTKAAKKHGIKHIYACEFYQAPVSRFEKDKSQAYYHLTVLAKNEQGRLNINKLISLANLEGFYRKPRIDFQLLSQFGEGLIIMSGCMASELQQTLAGGKIGDNDVIIAPENYKKAVEVARKYRQVFGEDYYLEVQSHSDHRQQTLNRAIANISKELKIPLVATADSHFINMDDQELHGIFVGIGNTREVGEVYKDCSIQSEEEVRILLKPALTDDEIEQSIESTWEIMEKCNAKVPLSAPLIPHVDVPEGFEDENDYLRSLCNKGWVTRGINKKPKEIREVYKDRLVYEYNAISKMGFSGYYLLVHGYANSVRRRGIARGSGGGSLIAYLMNIVNIDPIRYNLKFERFIDVGALDLLEQGIITPEELKIPDFDLDFGTFERELVVKGLIDTHGIDHVASIGSFMNMKDRGAVKDIGRVLGIPFEITNEITKIIGDDKLEHVLDDGLLHKYVKQYPKLFEYAKKLSGLPRSFSMHPCFTKGHLIMTSEGYKEIQDVQKGNMVLTHNNRFQSVHSTITSDSNNIFNISIMGSEKIKATGNHPFYCRKREKGRIRKYSCPDWINVDQLSKNDVIGIAINQESKLPNNRFNLPYGNINFWWLVGRYIGDGWTTYIENRDEYRNIICAGKPKNEIEDIKEKCEGLFKYHVSHDKTTDKLIIVNKGLFDYLNTFSKYANHKRLTGDILNLPTELLSSFLDGYFSADGHFDKRDYQNFKTVSRQLAYGIQACVHKVYKRICGITVIPEKEEVIEGRVVNSKEKYMLFFKKETGKKDRAFYEDGYIWTPVKSVEKVEDLTEEVYNLAVVDDNSYTVNNMIVHNCGKCVTIDPVNYYTALSYNEGEPVMHLDMKDCDALGLVKCDFLGLRTIDVIYDTLDMIGKDETYIDPELMDMQDKEVFEVFSEGCTDGVFQFESDGMKATLKKMVAGTIDDLGIVNALYRPGSLKYIDNYINRKFGLEKYEYLHPDLESILSVTYGIIVFQEQLIEIGRMSGLRNPDLLRKATGKKDAELLAQVEPELRQGLYNRGWSVEQVDQLWHDMLEFAKYSFNASHSYAYAIIAFICAKLKAYHPTEFMCALFNSYEGKHDKMENCFKEAKRLGVQIAPLSFENPQPICKVENNQITYGLTLIKHCNKQIAEEIRSIGTDFDNFSDLLIELKEKTSINSRQLNILMKLGFFSKFGSVERLLEIYEVFNKRYKITHKPKTKVKRIEELHEFESSLDNEINLAYDHANKKEFFARVSEAVSQEKEYLGFIRYASSEIDIKYYQILNIDTKYTPTVTLYNFNTGAEQVMKVKKKNFYDIDGMPRLSIADVVNVKDIKFENKKKKNQETGEWMTLEDMNMYIENCSLIYRKGVVENVSK